MCVFEMHMNTLECSLVVHHQLQSQYSMNTVQFIKCVHMYLPIYIYICTKPMVVHMSGLYSSTVVVVVVMQ